MRMRDSPLRRTSARLEPCLEGARLHRLMKNSLSTALEGAYLQLRRYKSFIFVIPNRLYRPLKNSTSARFVSGYDFSRADKLFVFVIPSGLQPARDLLFRLFQQPVQSVRDLPFRVFHQPLQAWRTSIPNRAALQVAERVWPQAALKGRTFRCAVASSLFLSFRGASAPRNLLFLAIAPTFSDASLATEGLRLSHRPKSAPGTVAPNRISPGAEAQFPSPACTAQLKLCPFKDRPTRNSF